MNGKGEIIEEQEYIWMDNSNGFDEMLATNEFKVILLNDANFSWRQLLDAAQPVFNVNFYQSVMMMAGAIACFHYPYAIQIADACPAPMAIGAPGSGKSTTIDLISKMLGSKVESQATGEVIQSLLWKSTVPLCWDDPTYPSTVRAVLAGSFDSKGKRTKGKGKEVPLTNVVLAVNFELEDDLRSFERIVPIVYSQPESPEDSAKYREDKEKVFSAANTACIPNIIKMGGNLWHNRNLVDEQVNFFKLKDPGLPPRIHKLYGLYKAIVHEIINEYDNNKMDDEDDITNAPSSITVEEYEKYLDNTFLPYVRTVVRTSTHIKESGDFEHFCKSLRRCLEGMKDDKTMKKSLKADVKTRSGQCIYMILPDILELIKQRVGPVEGSFNLSKLRKDISELDGTSIDHSATFEGSQRRCVKLPRELVPKDVLTAIDEACGAEREQKEQNTATCTESSTSASDNENFNMIKDKLDAAMKENMSLVKEKKELQHKLHQEKLRNLATEETLKKLERQLAAAKKETNKDSCQAHQQLHPKENPMCRSVVASAFSSIVNCGNENLADHDSSIDGMQEGTNTELPAKSRKRPVNKSREVEMLKDTLHKGIVQGKRRCHNS